MTRPRPLTRLVAALRSRRSRPRSVRLGIAIGPDRVVAVELGFGILFPHIKAVHTRPLAPFAEDGSWPDLTEALRELMATLGAQRARAAVALLRPLASAKIIAVPSLGRRDLRSLVSRNVRRFFIAGNEPVRSDARRLRRGRRGENGPAVAVCAGRRALDAIQASLEATGMDAHLITAAPLGVIEAIVRRIPGARRGNVMVAIGSNGWHEGIALTHGRPASMQPWPRCTADGPERLVTSLRAAQEINGRPASAVPAVVLADPDTRATVLDAVSHSTDRPPVQGAGLDALEPAAIAAYGAALLPEDAPGLGSEAAQRRVERRIRHRVFALASVAAMLLAVTGALHVLDLNRELRTVAAARHAITDDVEQALEMRRLVDAVQERLAALASVEAKRVDWTPTLAALAEALPDSAYLISMTAEGLDIRLAGVASTASAIVPALEASPILSNVSLNVARRQEGARERFDVALVLDRGPPPVVLPERGNR